MVFDIFNTVDLKKEFWDWYCNLETLERYAQHARIDLWENYKEKIGFKSSSYKLQFITKSSLEQAQIMCDFLENKHDIAIGYRFIKYNNIKNYIPFIDGNDEFLYVSKQSYIDKTDAYIDVLNYIVKFIL